MADDNKREDLTTSSSGELIPKGAPLPLKSHYPHQDQTKTPPNTRRESPERRRSASHSPEGGGDWGKTCDCVSPSVPTRSWA
jgi:hypothetical protein